MGYSKVNVREIDPSGPGGADRLRASERLVLVDEVAFRALSLLELLELAGLLDLEPGRFVRIDGSSTRLPIAGDDGLEFVTFGAPVGGRYEPPSWG